MSDVAPSRNALSTSFEIPRRSYVLYEEGKTRLGNGTSVIRINDEWWTQGKRSLKEDTSSGKDRKMEQLINSSSSTLQIYRGPDQLIQNYHKASPGGKELTAFGMTFMKPDGTTWGVFRDYKGGMVHEWTADKSGIPVINKSEHMDDDSDEEGYESQEGVAGAQSGTGEVVRGQSGEGGQTKKWSGEWLPRR